MAKAGVTQAGHELCLDFSNTVDWRNGPEREDRLTSFNSLVSWSVKKGLVTKAEAQALARESGGRHMEEEILDRAIQLRETIYRIFSGVAHETPPSDEEIARLNNFLSSYSTSSRVVKLGGGFTWEWVPGKGLEGRILWPIAKSAADLLTSELVERVTECANVEQGCGWIFLDKSKSGTRRWCSMDGCGNRSKVRAWYERQEHTGQTKAV
jgi:predicted RNA-binding Zn ribbon-like protein